MNKEKTLKKNSSIIKTDLESAFLASTMHKKSLTNDDKKALLFGALLTRAVDNALKHLFLSGEIRYQEKGFQGKGFRSLGQEAIYGAAYGLIKGKDGDVVAPLIRDLGVFLHFSDHDVVTALNAQAGKEGLPCEGRDLHLGDLNKGILIPAAPLAIATCTLLGIALSFKYNRQKRVAVSFIGEGGTSLGEWHEAINFAATQELPMLFCIENNQTALSTPVKQQSKAHSFSQKAQGYGIPSLTLDGNDIEEMYKGFKFASEFSRKGQGPVLIEVKTMRMCGHAHHDDMLYLGYDPPLDFTIPPLKTGGYAQPELFEEWRQKDPILNYKKNLIKQGIITESDYEALKKKALGKVEGAKEIIKNRSWPVLESNDENLVYKKPYIFSKANLRQGSQFTFSSQGVTYLQAIADAVAHAFKRWPECRMIGEDVAPPYGNAFMMFKNITGYNDRFINSPISENAIVGACVGMAIAGMKPIGEMQFNDFVACAMNQVVNNAAKHYFRTGQNVPMVLRMPYGGLRRAGPFHSQDTSAWFARVAGLKIMVPSTPIDAYFMLLKAIEDPDPVLFYEHIALYREPSIKQEIPDYYQDVEGASIARLGQDITLITYGAFTHRCLKAAERLLEKNINAEVIDLRYLKPLDFATCHASIKKTGRALLVTEDSVSGSVLENLAGALQMMSFLDLDAPITVIGSRNIPVPYAPSLEDNYLASEQMIIEKAFELMAF